MKQVEFDTKISGEKTIQIPSQLAEQVGAHQVVHVVVSVSDDGGEQSRATSSGRAEGDNVIVGDNIFKETTGHFPFHVLHPGMNPQKPCDPELLKRVRVRLVSEDERPQFDDLLEQRHYLKICTRRRRRVSGHLRKLTPNQ